MKRNDIMLFTACLFLVGVAVFFFVLAVACTKTTTVQANTTDAKLADGAAASLSDVCKHLVSVGCGHDTTACVAGLAGEVDSGLVLVNLRARFRLRTSLPPWPAKESTRVLPSLLRGVLIGTVVALLTVWLVSR